MKSVHLKKSTTCFAAAVFITAAAAIFIYGSFFREIIEIKGLSIGRTDLSILGDGAYDGVFHTPYNDYYVKVVVDNHFITHIDLKGGNSLVTYFDRQAKVVIDKVLKLQKTDVDVISGATVSSKAILMAIHNALNQIQKE